MTREEAKNILRNAAWLGSNDDRDRTEQAVEMAIKALDKDIDAPVTDTISRRDVMRMLTSLSYNQCKTQGEADVIDIAKTMVITMPSAQPEIIACGDCKHWICHDRRCGYWNHGVKPLMWCSEAERREDEQAVSE